MEGLVSDGGGGETEIEPFSLETDSGGRSAEPMETGAGPFVPAVPVANYRGTSADQRTFTTVREEMVGFNRNMKLLGRFNSDGNCLYQSEEDSRVLQAMKKHFNEMEYYDVKEPVGCGFLVGCRGRSCERPLTDAVFKDVRTMDWALKKTGEWMTKCLDKDGDLLKKQSFYRELNDVRLVGLDKYSVFLFYFSGHGNHKGVLLDDNNVVAYEDIVNRVSKLKELENKPKVFVFDTCRNEILNVNVRVPKGIRSDILPPDCLICFATTCSSFMDKSEGSFYTLALAHSLRSFGQRYMLHEVVTYAAHISREYGKVILNRKDVDQLPMFLSSLNKLLILSG